MSSPYRDEEWDAADPGADEAEAALRGQDYPGDDFVPDVWRKQ